MHHGILGQKWGVRRFQNEDGSLKPAGEKRYNKDSDLVAYAYGKKVEALVNLNDKKKKGIEALHSDPKNFHNSKEGKEYMKAMNDANIAFERAKKTLEPILKKYKDVQYDMLTENKTGEQYIRSVLTSKTGDVYVSEIYLGLKVE